ncbi:MAG: ester cyclase [Chitinophagaceae bacterium]
MEQHKQNKEFIIRYFNALSGVPKTREILEKYITDEELLGHIAFFEAAFPNYEVFADEMTAEGNRVVVRARLKGCHEGEFNGMLPTHRNIDIPFVVSYEIENGKIAHHWLIADQMALMEQLGVMNVPA